ncbi:MAG: hypothetical protein WA124_02140, partial [Smithella sp.]
GKTTYWRAGCGKSASPVRREGRRKPMLCPYPYSYFNRFWIPAFTGMTVFRLFTTSSLLILKT